MRLIIIIAFLLSACNQPDCAPNTTSFVPIPELTNSTFSEFTGGKYEASNRIPSSHAIQGMQQAKQLVPVTQFGAIDSTNGKIGMLVLGFSTAAMTGRFVREINRLSNTNASLEIIIGAQGGRDINHMTDMSSSYWLSVDSAVIKAGCTAAQIQIIWLSSGDIEGYSAQFPQQCCTQIEKYQVTLKHIKKIFPNCKIVMLSDRTYAGYVGLNGEGPIQLAEPTAYYNGWTIKWLIQKQINGDIGFSYDDIPFIDWGPYLWTNGTTPNDAGYTWDCSDAGKGGIHPTSKGRMKEGAIVYQYFSNHPYFEQLFY